MGMFSFFGDGEHRVFNYKPVYYDPEKEERRRRFGRVDGTLKREAEEAAAKAAGPAGKDAADKAPASSYVPGSYVKGAFKDGNYRSVRGHATRIQTIIGIITMLLVFAVLYMIAKFYMSL